MTQEEAPDSTWQVRADASVGNVVWAPLEDGQYRVAIVVSETEFDPDGNPITHVTFLGPNMEQVDGPHGRYTDSLYAFDPFVDVETHPYASVLQDDAKQAFIDTAAYLVTLYGGEEDDAAAEERQARKEAKRREKERKADEKKAAKEAARSQRREAAASQRHDTGAGDDDDDNLFERPPVPGHDASQRRREVSAVGHSQVDDFVQAVLWRIDAKKVELKKAWAEGAELDKAFVASERDIVERAKELAWRRFNVIPDLERAAADHSRSVGERQYAKDLLQRYQDFSLDDPDFEEIVRSIDGAVRRTPFAPREAITAGQKPNDREVFHGSDPLLRVNMFSSRRSLDELPPVGSTLGRNDVSSATFNVSSSMSAALAATSRPLMAGWREARRKARGDERRVHEMERMRSSFTLGGATQNFNELRGATHIDLTNFAKNQVMPVGVPFAPSAIPSVGAPRGPNSARPSARTASAAASVVESAAPRSILPLASDPFAVNSGGNSAVLAGVPPQDPFALPGGSRGSSVSVGGTSSNPSDASIVDWRQKAKDHLRMIMTPYFRNKSIRTEREFAQLGKKLLDRIMERQTELHGGSALTRVYLPPFTAQDAKSITRAVTDYLVDYRRRADAAALKARTIQSVIPAAAAAIGGAGMTIQEVLASQSAAQSARSVGTSVDSSRNGKRDRRGRSVDQYGSTSVDSYSDYSTSTGSRSSRSSSSRSGSRSSSASSSASSSSRSSSGSSSSSSASSSSASSSSASSAGSQRGGSAAVENGQRH